MSLCGDILYKLYCFNLQGSRLAVNHSILFESPFYCCTSRYATDATPPPRAAVCCRHLLMLLATYDVTLKRWCESKLHLMTRWPLIGLLLYVMQGVISKQPHTKIELRLIRSLLDKDTGSCCIHIYGEV